MQDNISRLGLSRWCIFLAFCIAHTVTFAHAAKSLRHNQVKVSPTSTKKTLSAKKLKILSARKPPALQDFALESPLALRARAALVQDLSTGEILFEKQSHEVMPIASITKLMMALVVVESGIDLDEKISITEQDLRATMRLHSRLRKHSTLSRREMLRLALMSSENRAASALARTHPQGFTGFIAAMNERAQSLGMQDSRFVDASGLDDGNVSTSHDLVKLVMAADQYPLIREFSTWKSQSVRLGKRSIAYANSNNLISDDAWEIALQKTGTTSKAGRCLVLLTTISQRPVVMVLLHSEGYFGRANDARYLRSWINGNPSNDSSLDQITMVNN